MKRINKIEKAINDLKEGKLIVVLDDKDRENEGDLVGLASNLTAESINFMISKGKGLLCAAISINIAKKLNLNVVKSYKSDKTNFSSSVDHISNTTGISAFERLKTLKSLITDNEQQFKKPGHLFPLISKPKGLSQRRGHTEAAIDLAKLSNAEEVVAIIEIINKDGKMMRKDELLKFSKNNNLSFITIEELYQYIKSNRSDIWKGESYQELKFSKIAKIKSMFGEMNIQAVKDVFTSNEATLYWNKSLKGSLKIRIHSQCQTAEIFDSLQCDCNEQLKQFKNNFYKNDNYLLIYTHDDGRGIGHFNKINAYDLQKNGFDTVDANQKLGFLPDQRNFNFPAKILKKLNINNVEIFTNNPRKLKALENYNIKFKRCSFWVDKKNESKNYIKTKKNKLNHFKN